MLTFLRIKPAVTQQSAITA